ncbi:MAG: hypothetical protein ACK5U8_32685 [Deltaproteobacteria bacterium]
MVRTWWVGIAFWALMTSSAWAQGTPPDLVRMHDGSFVRGTIVESTPERVVIQLVTGEVRTIERSAVAEVRSSDSPATAATTPTAPSTSTTGTSVEATTGEGRHVVVRLRLGQFLFGRVLAETASAVTLALDDGNTRIVPRRDIAAMRDTMETTSATPDAQRRGPTTAPGPTTTVRVTTRHPQRLALHRHAGSTAVRVSTGRGYGTALIDSYDLICVAPCSATLPRGDYRVGVAQNDSEPVRVDGYLRLQSQSLHLELSYDDRSGLRIMGFLVMGFGSAIGLAMTIAGILVTSSSYDRFGVRRTEFNVPLLVSGGAVIATSLGVGLGFGALGDSAGFRITYD